MTWWDKLKGGSGPAAEHPVSQQQQQRLAKSHEKLAEEAMAQLMVMPGAMAREAHAGAGAGAGAGVHGGVDVLGSSSDEAASPGQPPRRSALAQNTTKPKAAPDAALCITTCTTCTTCTTDPTSAAGFDVVAQSQSLRNEASVPPQICTLGRTPIAPTSVPSASAALALASASASASISSHSSTSCGLDLQQPRPEPDTAASTPTTPTTVVTTASSSFGCRSRALSSVSVATTFSDTWTSPSTSARTSLHPSDCGSNSATVPSGSAQGPAPSPIPSPSPSSQPRRLQASPRSRRTCNALVNRSQPAVHAARVNRAATLSSSTRAPKESPRTPPDHRPRQSTVSSVSSNDSQAPDQSPGSNLTKMDNKWINVQQKTFTKWLNTKIQVRDVVVKDLVTDLSDGVVLIHLLECLSQESLGRYASKPKLRVQKFENANTALLFIKSRGIQMTNIGAEDVVDGNRKIILGLIWTLILRFTISDINEEGMTAKEGLLLWCQRKTACYDEVEVRDFSTSWNDGLAFCALLDIHRPDLIDFEALDKSDHRGNMQLAFDIAHKEIGIPDLLDVEDVCDVAKPDERSLMTYIAYWFHAFSQMEKVENAGRRVEKFVNNMQGAWEMQSAYEKRMAALLAQIRDQIENWSQPSFEGTYADAKQQAADFAAHKRGKKRQWFAERSDLATLLGNIKTKLGTYRLRAYDPPPHLGLDVMDAEWTTLTKAEQKHGQLINETIRDIKNALRKSFADKANDFALALNTMQMAISGLEGDVEDQLHHVRRLRDNLPPLDAFLEKIRATDEQCQEANIEENDFTTYTYDELTYELGLVKSSVQKKLVFLENQMVARDMTNLTPIQLEEFESVFRHFDRDDSNSLSEIEFSAALASLGLVFSEDEMHDYFLDTSNGRDRVTFEQFIRFMVSVTEDQNTAEQVYQSFREVADGKPYVTEMDLRHSLVPDEVIEKLVEIVPPHSGPDMQEDRGQPQYDYIAFMEKLMGGGGVLQDVTNGRSSPAKSVNGHS